jgi:hypothetical protein
LVADEREREMGLMFQCVSLLLVLEKRELDGRGDVG